MNPMNRIGRSRAQAGFTLVESMIAMFFLAYIVTQLAALSVAASRVTNLSKRTTLANQLADEAVEKTRNTAYDNAQLAIPSLNETATGGTAPVVYWESTIPGGLPYTRRRTVTPRDSAGVAITLATSNQADVDVAVSFTDSRGTVQTINVSSIISRY